MRAPHHRKVVITAILCLSVLLAVAGLLVRTTVRPATPRSTGWLVTVYYTAVESFHHDDPIPVTGCSSLHCQHGQHHLGRYPASFVAAVHDEGTGRITSGAHAGQYLNWSAGIGYWLDTTPRDAHGRSLLPFRSAAADNLAEGTPVRLIDCGRPDPAESANQQVCQRLRNGQWQIRDQFTPGLGGNRHIDLYIGEEDQPHFTDSALYTTLHDATLAYQ